MTETPAQKPQQSKSDTSKICQGVPIPDGYVVVAYMTSATCDHGAYLLKKQNNYESSLAVNGDSRQTADQTSSGKPNRLGSPSTGTSSARDNKSTAQVNRSSGTT